VGVNKIEKKRVKGHIDIHHIDEDEKLAVVE
jgi:hypothetical protein